MSIWNSKKSKLRFFIFLLNSILILSGCKEGCFYEKDQVFWNSYDSSRLGKSPIDRPVLELGEMTCYNGSPAYRYDWSCWVGSKLVLEDTFYYDGEIELFYGIFFTKDSVISILPRGSKNESGYPFFDFNMSEGDTAKIRIEKDTMRFWKEYQVWLVGKSKEEKTGDTIYEFKLYGLALSEETWTVFLGWNIGIVGMSLSSIYRPEPGGRLVEHIHTQVGNTNFQTHKLFDRIIDPYTLE